jgi:N6-adenosine-specific RNA methylase IME4
LLAGEDPCYQEWNGDEEDLVGFVISRNLKRRHLDASQRAVVGLAVEKYEAERARARQVSSAAKTNEELGRNTGGTIVEIFPQSSGLARDIAAAAVGVNPHYIQDAKRIEYVAPDLIPQIASGVMNIQQAKREIVKRARSASPPLPTPDEKYRVLYADPPWEYTQTVDGYGPVADHYTTMSIDALCALGAQVRDMVAQDSVLFLWTTSPMLENAFSVVAAWGFKYKTSFVWDKVKHNFGHYNSVRHELLLVCTRGSCTPDSPKLFDSVQTIERSAEHSEKPEEFRRIIDALYPNGKRIELFARKTVAGWEAWGNEI